MSSSSDTGGRRASVLDAPRAVTAPAFPDLATPESSTRTRTEVVDHRAAAWQAGYTDGYTTGEAEAAAHAVLAEHARAELRASAETLLASVRVAVDEVRARDALTLDAVALDLAQAAVQLAEAVLGREVTTGAEALARAMALVPASASPVARLHPADLEGLEGPEGVTVVADPSVERGGCLVEVEDTTIDAQLGPALARARAVLLGDTGEAW